MSSILNLTFNNNKSSFEVPFLSKKTKTAFCNQTKKKYEQLNQQFELADVNYQLTVH